MKSLKGNARNLYFLLEVSNHAVLPAKLEFDNFTSLVKCFVTNE